MIVPGDTKVGLGDAATVSSDTPPSYEASTQHTPPPTPSSSSTIPVAAPISRTPPNIPATNYTRIKRTNASIKGTYVIDAGLTVPEELLSHPTPDGNESVSSVEESDLEPRKNLYLRCINASVTAEVWLVDYEAALHGEPTAKRTELELTSKNGSVNLKLFSLTDRPYSVIAKAKNASVTVALPSNFIGPVSLSTVNGSVSLSSTVQSRLVTFSEENGTRKCFIGDYRRAGYSGRERWTGSSADFGSINGRVKLSFVDDPAPPPGFWSKLFGGI